MLSRTTSRKWRGDRPRALQRAARDSTLSRLGETSSMRSHWTHAPWRAVRHSNPYVYVPFGSFCTGEQTA